MRKHLDTLKTVSRELKSTIQDRLAQANKLEIFKALSIKGVMFFRKRPWDDREQQIIDATSEQCAFNKRVKY